MLTEYIDIDSLLWRHNWRDVVSNYRPHDCLLNRSFRHRSQKTSKLCITGLCAGNSPVTGEFPAQRASNAKNVSIWWRHHDVNNSLKWSWIRGDTKIWFIFSSLINTRLMLFIWLENFDHIMAYLNTSIVWLGQHSEYNMPACWTNPIWRKAKLATIFAWMKYSM